MNASKIKNINISDFQPEPEDFLGEVLQGLKKPHECPSFGGECTPQTPLGATMVSSEGACAAYYSYGRADLLPGSRSNKGDSE